jgi:hypothetical protein
MVRPACLIGRLHLVCRVVEFVRLSEQGAGAASKNGKEPDPMPSTSSTCSLPFRTHPHSHRYSATMGGVWSASTTLWESTVGGLCIGACVLQIGLKMIVFIELIHGT